MANINGYHIYKSADGHMIWNTSLPWDEGHTHGIRSLAMAEQIIDNVHKKRIPTTRREYLLESHIRLAGDTDYKDKLIGLKARRMDRKQIYFNPHLKR